MIRIRPADLDDPAQLQAIEDYVQGHAQGSVFHLPAWLRAIERGCNQVAHYLVAERDRAIVGLLPLTEIHSPLFGRALASAGFAVGGGVIADNEATVDALAEAAWSLAGRLSCPSLELRGGMAPTGPGWHVEGGT
ncbi:MAG: hypothetical protein JWR77_2458 [Rhizorhabdus sp.]|nr:hypothetical protein [Rhizorhabdus sp.]